RRVAIVRTPWPPVGDRGGGRSLATRGGRSRRDRFSRSGSHDVELFGPDARDDILRPALGFSRRRSGSTRVLRARGTEAGPGHGGPFGLAALVRRTGLERPHGRLPRRGPASPGARHEAQAMTSPDDFSLSDLFQEEVRAHTSTLTAGLLA